MMKKAILGIGALMMASAAVACSPQDLYVEMMEGRGAFAQVSRFPVEAPVATGKPVAAKKTHATKRWTEPEASREYDRAKAPKASDVAGSWKQVASATDSEVMDYRRLISDARLEVSDSLQVTLDEGAGPYQGTINGFSLDFSLSAHRRYPHAEAWDTVAYACRMASPNRMICLADWNYARRMMNQEKPTRLRQLVYLAFARTNR